MLKAIAIVFSWALTGAAATAAEGDRRVEKLLDRARIAYEMDGQGDFRVTYALDEGRSQMVIVRSPTTAYGALDQRELVSAAYRSTTQVLPPEVANRLLELNASARLGGWTRLGPMAVLVTRIPAEADGRELVDALEYTARAADAAERELNGGKDDY
jgi:hypothetical protein